MNVNTSNQVSAGVDAYFARELLERPLPYYVYAMFADLKPLQSKMSGTVRFRRFTSLSPATTALTEGVTPDGSLMAKTDTTAAVSQYGDFLYLSDYLRATSLENIVNESQDLLLDQMGQTLNRLARTVLIAGDNVQYASTAASTATIAAGMILNSEELAEAVLTLVNGDAKPITKQINPGSGFNSSPVPMAFVLFASPATVRDLSKDSNWIGVAEYGSQEKLGPWEVGTILAAGYAVRVITTGSDASTESSTVTVHKSVLIGQYAYAMVEIDELSVEMIHQPATDPLKQRESFGWKLATVFKRQAEYAIVRIEHAVS